MAAIRIGIDPVAFRLGPATIRWYGLMYVVAIFIGVQACRKVFHLFHAIEDELWDMLPWCIGAGLVGGRLFYVLQNRQSYYLHNPQHIFAFFEGGMAFFGAVGAVAITVVVYSRIRHIDVWPMLDVAAVFGAVGQPIGRIGNIINGDIVGYKTDLPWGFIYTNPHTLAPQIGVAYQPAPVYEIIANIILIVAMFLILSRWRPIGLAACVYLAGYSITQFIVFFARDNSITALGLKQAQLTSIVTLAISFAMFWYVLRRAKREKAEVEVEPG